MNPKVGPTDKDEGRLKGTLCPAIGGKDGIQAGDKLQGEGRGPAFAREPSLNAKPVCAAREER